MKKPLSKEMMMTIALVVILLILVVPLPPFFLDLMLSCTLVLSIVTLFLTLSIASPLEFSAFPSLLLLLTFLRLSLNIASTRMILSQGQAGAIIETFGTFVTGGNTWLGLLLFALLTVINFIVITKGAGRIAEVAARFTLEALAGKQAAVDAELQTGSLSGEEAKAARSKIAATAEFYGAMDGASKFIRGDALAGIVIIAINLLGGMVLGLTQGTSFGSCWEQYATLTIGDGLVTQLPALLLSLGGALMVARSSEGSVAEQLFAQLFTHPKVFLVGAVTLVVLALLPGMPKLLLFALALLCFALHKKGEGKATEKGRGSSDLLLTPPIEVLLGAKLLPLAEALLKEAAPLREQIHREMGWLFPSLHIRDDLKLEETSFQIKIKGSIVSRGTGSLQEIVKELHATLVENAFEFLNRQEVALLLEKVKESDAAVVEELIPKKLSLGGLLKILQNLLKERFKIVDLVTILETIADQIPHNEQGDPDLLTEGIRRTLAKQTLADFLGERRMLYAITLDPKVEQMLLASTKKEGYKMTLCLRPATIENIERELAPLIQKAEQEKLKVALLTSVSTRKIVSQLLEKHRNFLPIFSFEEIGTQIPIHSLGSISTEVLI